MSMTLRRVFTNGRRTHTDMQTMFSAFEGFRKAIEPDGRVKKIAQAADDPVREHLEGHHSFAKRHVTTFLYGSYKRHTAEGDIKDVDLVVVTNFTLKCSSLIPSERWLDYRT
jgi:tRNA nucleotidyltransferase (CCA-adding enzyme)